MFQHEAKKSPNLSYRNPLIRERDTRAHGEHSNLGCLPEKKIAMCRAGTEKEHEESREKSSDCTFCQENNGIKFMLEHTETKH